MSETLDQTQQKFLISVAKNKNLNVANSSYTNIIKDLKSTIGK